jgi:hypothetical protein
MFSWIWYNQKCADKKEDSLMKVMVYGNVSDSLERKLTSAANFYAKVLLGEKLAKQIRVDIEVELEMENDNQGECFPEDENRNPRYFTIRLAKQKNDNMLRTLAHEMVHLKQYAKNQLSYKFKQNRTAKKANPTLEPIWEGKIWKPKKDQHHYWNAPWEMEAYALEPGLFYRFMENS